MGYIETILGYGGNHVYLPLRLFFKSINGEKIKPLSSPMDEVWIDNIEEMLENGEKVTLNLQDDIYLQENPEDREIIISDVDDLESMLDDFTFISKENGHKFEKRCCFEGIVISSSSDYPENKDEDLQDRIEKLGNWVQKLKSEGRLQNDIKLVMVPNCCS